jgi:hypothetical protein
MTDKLHTIITRFEVFRFDLSEYKRTKKNLRKNPSQYLAEIFLGLALFAIQN